jgi:hypothetical protein
MAALGRLWDRGCTSNRKSTKQVTQQDYENKYTGAELQMDYKYANILVVTLLVMTYGSGIPIMYPIAALYFFATYWVDKSLIFYNYRKPLFFDEKLALHTQGYLKLAIILHLIVGALMLSNSHILPVKKKA